MLQVEANSFIKVNLRCPSGRDGADHYVAEMNADEYGEQILKGFKMSFMTVDFNDKQKLINLFYTMVIGKYTMYMQIVCKIQFLKIELLHKAISHNPFVRLFISCLWWNHSRGDICLCHIASHIYNA